MFIILIIFYTKIFWKTPSRPNLCLQRAYCLFTMIPPVAMIPPVEETIRCENREGQHPDNKSHESDKAHI